MTDAASTYNGGGCYLEGVTLDEPIKTTPDDPLHGKIRHCARSVSIAVNPWFEDFVRYKKGILPKAGGWNDQDNVVCEVLQLIDSETDRETAEEIAKLRKEQRKQLGKG